MSRRTSVRRWRTTRVRILVASILVAGCLAAPAQATATAYYVDNRTGSNCSDSGAGTSQSAPWCSFTPAASHTFTAGDQLLLARGATWNQQLSLLGSGTSLADSGLISIGAYGSGARPIIDRQVASESYGVYLANQSYVRVKDLEIAGAKYGLAIVADTGTRQGLRASNVYVRDNCFGMYSSNVGSSTMEFRLDDVESSHNNGSWLSANGASSGVVNRLYAHDDDGRSWNPDPTTCPTSMSGGAVNTVTYVNTLISRSGSHYYPNGTTGMFFNGGYATFVNGAQTTTPHTGSPDESGMDVEANYYGSTDNIRIRNSFIGDNQGPGIEILALSCGTQVNNTNLEISGNMFSNNGQYKGGPLIAESPGYGGIHTARSSGCTGFPTGTIRDNLYFEPTGFTYASGGSSFANMTQTNNRAAAGLTNQTHAGNDFDCGAQGTNGWSYQQSTNGTTWTNLSSCYVVTASDEQWKQSSGDTSNFVSRFEQFPPSSTTSWIGRSWTAPSTGTISIRGRALTSDYGNCSGGDGVIAEIRKNTSSTPISGTYTVPFDLVGVETNVDDYSVTAGDVRHFGVRNNSDNTCDRTSWTPGIAYTSIASGSTTYVASTDFSDAQSANQWTYQYATPGYYTYTDLANYDSTNSRWRKTSSAPAPYVLIGSTWQHADSDDSVRTWTAPAAGSVTITDNDGNVRLSNSGGDGTVASVLVNGSSTAVWSSSITTTTGVNMGTLGPITVAAGDQVHFRLNQNSTITNDTTLWNPKVAFTPTGGVTSYVASTGFGGTQSANQWTYQYATPSSYTYTNLADYDSTNSRWRKTSSAPAPYVLIGSTWQHADSDDSVRTWTAPAAGSVTITDNDGNVRLSNSGGDGTVASVLVNGSSTPVWSSSITTTTGVNMGTLGPITVAAGDQIHFRLNQNSTITNDTTLWNPKVTFNASSAGTPYIASADFSDTQSANQWTFQYAASGSYSYTNLASFDTASGWWRKTTSAPAPYVLIGPSWQHADSDDAVRTWTAPAAGTITITDNDGNVRLSNSGGDGTVASVLVNGSSTAVWSSSITTTSGVSMGTLGPITVAAGDQIHFRLNQNSSITNDTTLWNPKVTFTP